MPAAALTFSTEMVLQQGLKEAHTLNAPVDTHAPRYLSKPLWSTAMCSAHFQASQLLNATQKSLASSGLSLLLLELG